MSTPLEMRDSLLGLLKRRPGSHGKWIPTAYWIDKMKINELDNRKLMKALEATGSCMTKIDNATHGFLYIEITKRRIDNVGIRWFLCCSTPDKPDQHSKGDSKLFGKVLNGSYDRYNNKGEETVDETAASESLANTEQAQQDTHSPSQPTATTTSVTPSTDSPQLNQIDSDLLTFFRGIINEECLARDDLFRSNITSNALRSKIVTFGKSLAADSLVKHYQAFYDTSVPVEYTNKDITKLDPCPLLAKYNIPMSVPAVREVATAIVNLAADVPEALQLQKCSGSKGFGKRLVPIAPSTDTKNLYYSAKQWMKDVVSAAVTDDTASYDIVHTLIKVLRTFEPLAFEDVVIASESESCRSAYKLDPELQEAMMYESGVNWSQLRIIKKYLCYSSLDILQPEHVIRSLQVSDFVRPTSIEFREGKGKRKRVAWTIPCDELLQHKANQCLEADSFQFDRLSHAHIILVGDHGQGALRIMVTLLLIASVKRRDNRRHSGVNECIGTELVLEVDGLCAYVQCQKDAYEVMKDTVAGPINDSLWNIKNKRRVTIYRNTAGNVQMCFGNIHTTQGQELASAKVELFMTGDLAWYAMVLGKEAMAPHWCWRCNMTKQEWTEAADAIRVGQSWTVANMRSHYNKLESGELNKKKPEQVKGVTQPMLIDCMDMCNIPVPPLHNNELFVNHPINKGLMLWINHRIENLPVELIDARLEEIDLILELESIADQLKAAKERVEFLSAEAKALKPQRKKRNGVMTDVYRDAEHESDHLESRTLLSNAKEELVQLESLCSDFNKDRKAQAKKILSISKKKEHGALSQEIRQRIDQMLQELYNIIRSAYHGGDFEGNHCRKFIRNADTVMDSIQELLLAIPPEDRAASNDEIRRYCRAYKRLFQYFDLLIHYCQQSFGTLTDSDIVDVRKLVLLLDRLWRRLFDTVPPKAHAWWHLVEDLERFRGLKHHQESKIEVSHQVGRKIDLLFRSVNDREKKIECSLRHQHTMDKPSMKLIQSEVQKKRSRKRKASSDDTNSDVNDRHAGLLLLSEIEDDFPTLQQLAVDDRRRETESEGAVNNNHTTNNNTIVEEADTAVLP